MVVKSSKFMVEQCGAEVQCWWCRKTILEKNLDILVHRQYGAKVGGAGKSINILVQEYGARIVWCRFQQYGGRGK